MGIPKFTSFIRRQFTGWRVEEILKGPLVIDGDSLCFDLYHFDWTHGGEYVEYREHVSEYFTALKASGIEPIVVLDGIDYTREKRATIASRWAQCAREVRCQFRPEAEQPRSGSVSSPGTDVPSLRALGGNDRKICLPKFAKKVFSDVLNELQIEFVVVDGDADKETALLANFYSCPVLSNDSDFFIYNVTGGFIHMNNFEWKSKPITCKVYSVKALAGQFKFADESLRYIIPAIMGNDLINALPFHDCMRFFKHMKQVTSYAVCSSRPTDSETVTAYASFYDNLQDFINRIQSIEYLSESWKKILCKNCIKSKEIYDITGVLTLENIRSTTKLKMSKESEIPRWLLSQYRQLNLSNILMNVLVLGCDDFHFLAEDPQKVSSYCVSIRLRRAAYNIIGLGSVGEGLPIGSHHLRFKIPKCMITCDDQKVDLSEIPKLSLSTKKKIMYYFLYCKAESDLIESLDANWRLVIASVVFWTKRANAPLAAIKALLLTFVLCSSGTYSSIDLPDDIPISSPESSEGAHYFMQWQCSYSDALVLNSVLQGPLEFYSPGYLFSGRLALHLYMSSDASVALSKLPKSTKELHAQLLSIVMSHNNQDKVTRSDFHFESGRAPPPGLIRDTLTFIIADVVGKHHDCS